MRCDSEGLGAQRICHILAGICHTDRANLFGTGVLLQLHGWPWCRQPDGSFWAERYQVELSGEHTGDGVTMFVSAIIADGITKQTARHAEPGSFVSIPAFIRHYAASNFRSFVGAPAQPHVHGYSGDGEHYDNDGMIVPPGCEHFPK